MHAIIAFLLVLVILLVILLGFWWAFKQDEPAASRPNKKETEIPLYQCHKRVRAFKIGRIVEPSRRQVFIGSAAAGLLSSPDFRHTATVRAEYFEKHKPRPGGFYILYEDGYESYSPAQAFESGYTRIDG